MERKELVDVSSSYYSQLEDIDGFDLDVNHELRLFSFSLL
jgi:hypothetical protein